MSTVYWLAREGSALAKWTSRPVRHVLGSAVGAACYLAWRSKRLVTQQNMAQVTGRHVHDPHVRHLAYASWSNYGRYAADFLNFPNLDSCSIDRHLQDLTGEGTSWQERVAHALEPGRGIIFTGAHFGNWDIAGIILSRIVPLSAVAETFRDRRLNELLQNQRKEKGINIIPMEGSARRILRVLQQNQAVAIIADRPMTAEQGVPISFFGRTTYVPGGPAAFALKSGASIVPGYVWYGPRNLWYVRAFPPIFPEEYRSGDHTKDVVQVTQRIYTTVEEMVRKWPTQWYMFRPFWPPHS